MFAIQSGSRRLVVALVAVVIPLAGGMLGSIPDVSPSAPRAVPARSADASPHVPHGLVSALGVGGTTSADLADFAAAFNAERVTHHLRIVPLAHFRYDACMEKRLFWMAEDPSTNVTSAWGHIGSKRSDGVPSVGCDGNLAGGTKNTGATVAIKWWNSLPHRASLYKPTYTASMATVCIYFAMTHGGLPDEPIAFTRAAARWSTC